VSDLLQAASNALGTPPELVQRSAAARAAASGTSVDDILSAWSGGAPAPAPSVAAAAPETSLQPQEEPGAAAEAEPAPVALALAKPVVETPLPAIDPEPEERLEPVPLRLRMKTAVRIGAWTGAALGVVGFLAASAFWASNATFLPESGPVVQVNPNTVIVGIALVSVVFGAIVAGVSRAATAWTNPAMQLSGSKAATAWLGAGIGLALGVVAGAMLNGFGTAVEGSEPAVVQLPVLATLFVMVIGGAVSGAMTALVPQVLGVPVAVDESDEEEVATIKSRLGHAMSIPLAGLLLMGLLVLPFAYALIESNHLAPGVGGAVVAIIAAIGILGFAALAGTKPEMRISFGDAMVALIGIGVVLVIIISVLFATTGDDHSEEPPEGSAVVRLI
jgi:MFS family permease